MRCYLIVALLTGISSQCIAADITNAELDADCTKKTIVFNKEGERVGDKIGSFCVGYLQATFSALLISAKCNKDADFSGEYLLSVYQSYVKEKKIPATDSASRTLTQAFRRAADCK